MDGTAVAELLRTRQPVIRTSTDPITGTTKTTTYKLDADGSISSHTVTKSKSHTTFRSPQQLPPGISLDDLLKSPTGSITRTYTDAEGRRVTQTFRVNQPRYARPIDGSSQTANRHPIKPLSSNWHETETSALFGDNSENDGDWIMVSDDPEPTTIKPRLSLEEFLEQQYGKSAKASTTTAKPLDTTVKTININELPITEIYYNGKPAGDDFLKTLPPHLRPKVTNTENVIKIENIPQMVGESPSKVETNITKFSTTHTGSSKPTLEDLSPEMQDILKRAGISTDDISNIEGDTITKTRKEPDGRIITTRYRVNSMPTTVTHHEFQTTLPRREFFSSFDTNPFELTSSSKPSTEPTLSFSKPSIFDYSHSLGSPSHVFKTYHDKSFPDSNTNSWDSSIFFDSPSTFDTSFKTFQSSFHPSTSVFTESSSSPISSFLAKLGLSKSDILDKNGQYTKTIVDSNGQILTVSFILSQPVQPVDTKKTEQPKKAKPMK